MSQARLDTMRPGHPFVGRIDPYTRTPFVLNERFVVCGGSCGRAYKLVTCAHLNYRCERDGASLRVDEGQRRPIRVTRRSAPLTVSVRSPRSVWPQAQLSVRPVTPAPTELQPHQPQPSPVEEVFLALFRALSWLRHRGLPGLRTAMVAVVEWVQANAPVAREWARRSALSQVQTATARGMGAIRDRSKRTASLLARAAERLRRDGQRLVTGAQLVTKSLGQRVTSARARTSSALAGWGRGVATNLRALRLRLHRKRKAQSVPSSVPSLARSRRNVLPLPLVAAALTICIVAISAVLGSLQPGYMLPILTNIEKVSAFAVDALGKVAP